MADPITMALIGTAMGGAKHLGDVAGNENDRRTGATTQKWSAWTGQQAKKPRTANLAGNLIPGALTGLSLGQAFGGTAPGGDFASGMSGFGPTAPGAPTGWGAVAGYGDQAAKTLSPWMAASMMGGGR